MAQHTLGRRIVELGEKYENNGRKGEPPSVKILNKEYPLKARVVQIGGFSAHADKNELFRFLQHSGLKIKKIAAVHGEEKQTQAFAEFLRKKGYAVIVPRVGESVQIR
jgi:metallo-beta-lactamase family protein